MQELVEGSPSVTEDGAFLLGSRDTTIYMIDAETGELIRAFLEFNGQLTEVETLLGALQARFQVTCTSPPGASAAAVLVKQTRLRHAGS